MYGRLKTHKVFSEPSGPQRGADLRFLTPFLQPDTSLHCETTNTKASALRGMPVYGLAFASTHCAYSRKDSQAELA